MFQFHIGSIKKRRFIARLLGAAAFQFHIGSIKKRTGSLLSSTKCFSFNSTLVQLKNDANERESLIASMFQFHIGSIKNAERFNNRADNDRVSIPHWFN